MKTLWNVAGWLGLFLLGCGLTAQAADEFEKAPINYSQTTPANVVERLQTELSSGRQTLRHDEDYGYLPALLEALKVPVDSQMLVFSKTSMQRARISPRTPRAIYFSDEVYVGYCQQGQVLELSAVDPTLGAVFYTLDQEHSDVPRLTRQTENCLLCHSSSSTGEIPSHLVRSIFPDASGLPVLSEGSHRVDHTTPLEDRWGGWYVTGTHGSQTHLGNLIVRDTPLKRPVTNPEGVNVTTLEGRFDTAKYLTPHSDVVALMVLEHQAYVQNLITKANFATRQALHYQAEFNRELKEPPDYRLESTTRRITNAADQLVRGLLFAGEAPLTAPIAGTSPFQKTFVERGRRDRQGRSLREFDLTTRMFKYRCSYLIDSPAFDGLPLETKTRVASRLRSLLVDGTVTPPARPDDFPTLPAEERRVLWEILCDLKPDLFHS